MNEKFRLRQHIEKGETQARIQEELEQRLKAELKAKQDEDARNLRILCLDSALELVGAIPKLDEIIHDPAIPGPLYELVTDGEKLYAAVAMLGKFEERMRVMLVNLAETIESMKMVIGLRSSGSKSRRSEGGLKLSEDAETLKENLEELYY